MKEIIQLLFISLILFTSQTFAQQPLDSLLTVRGMAIAAPNVDEVDRFVTFIDEELAPRNVNTLILRIDYNYQYESRPELRDSEALSKEDVKKLVTVDKKNNIRIIPQVNLLGHQSWAGDLGNLLEEYPEFDETPDVEIPDEYEWPNEDGLYCKSYCPLHPDVHDVVFDIVDEIVEVFEADAFHAGMDEVFYIGHEQCPRCNGRDKAELYAGEVTKIRNHLADQGVELWIWGDRLIDGKTTGIGMWEASMNNTHRAIDLIPKDVVINDWHYVKAYPTAVHFAMKGFRVISCPWRIPSVAIDQVNDMVRFKNQSTDVMKDRYYGVMHTVWTSAGNFMDGFYENRPDEDGGTNTMWHTFRMMYDEINQLDVE